MWVRVRDIQVPRSREQFLPGLIVLLIDYVVNPLLVLDA